MSHQRTDQPDRIAETTRVSHGIPPAKHGAGGSAVANVERVREFLSAQPEDDYFRLKAKAGWRLVSVDWERDAPGVQPVEPVSVEEVPFGLKIADDGQHLTEQPPERQALMRMMEMIVQDEPLTQIAVELNRNGYRMRSGIPWTPSALFDLLPRLIEAGPKILTDEEYVSRKRHSV